MATGELGLIRFLGINKMARSNPFNIEPAWPEAHSVVLAALAPTGADYTGIESLLRCAAEQGPSALGASKAALLMACFHECFLCTSLLAADLPKVARARVAELLSWLQDDNNAAIAAACSAQERCLLLFFSGVPLPAAHATLLQPVSNLMRLAPGSGSDQVMLVTLIAHLAAVVLAASPALPAGHAGADPAALYRCLCMTVERMVGSHLPAMPEDVQSMAIRVLGGRWYKCPNGTVLYNVS